MYLSDGSKIHVLRDYLSHTVTLEREYPSGQRRRLCELSCETGSYANDLSEAERLTAEIGWAEREIRDHAARQGASI